MGFVESVVAPSVYRCAKTGVRVLTHVDDFLCTGPAGQLKSFYDSLGKVLDLKCELLGPGNDGEQKQGTFLGRTISWETWGISYEGDRRILENMLKEWDMRGCSSVSTPWTRDESSRGRESQEEVLVDSARIAKFRRAAARFNYMSLDDPRISYASKEISRSMAQPTVESELKVKRVMRYLSGWPRCLIAYPWQDPPSQLIGSSDSDWGGCTKTRRSTSGGGIMLGSHLLSHWSRTQTCVALSSGEAELNAMLKAGCEGLHIQNLLRELGVQVGLHLRGDSSASQGTLQRLGAGKVKHLYTRQVWLQEKVHDQSVSIEKIPRSINWADVLSHGWTSSDLQHFHRMGVYQIAFRTNFDTSGC